MEKLIKDIRRIGVRQFQQNFHKELVNTPFILTKDGKDYKRVSDVDEHAMTEPELRTLVEKFALEAVEEMVEDGVVKALIEAKIKKMKEDGTFKAPDPAPIELDPLPDDGTDVATSPTGKCEMPNTTCKGIGYAYLVTFQTDEGEVTNEYFLCDNHLASARKKYKVREI